MATFESTLTILDVGHGNSAVVIDTDGVVVIDTGLRGSLHRFLKQAGVDTVDVVLLSHADQDHIGGLVQLLAIQDITIKRVHVNADSVKESRLWSDLRYELDRAHNAGELTFETSLVSDNSGKFDQGDAHIEVLGPSRFLASGGPGSKDRDGRRITGNSISAVIRISIRGEPLAFLAGDLDSVGLDDLLRANDRPHARMLVFPHHGGKAGATDLAAFAARLCDAVQPESVVFSIGRGRFGNPLPEIVEVIRKKLPNAWIACTQLSEHCTKSLPAVPPSHLNDASAQGKELCQCCAGTITIDFGDPDSVSPSRKAHEAFVLESAPQALCMGGTQQRDSRSVSE